MKNAASRPGHELLVIAGLDPAIHPLRKTLSKRDGYAGLRLAEGASAPQAGQAPRMTLSVLQRLAKISDSNFKQPSARILAPPRELGF
jgi:hypothetical protein